jgi:hypothetical protein
VAAEALKEQQCTFVHAAAFETINIFLATSHYIFIWKMALFVKLQYESWSSFIEREPLDTEWRTKNRPAVS